MSVIGIIGYGFVGEAVAHGFKDKHKILIYDKFKESDSFDEVVNKSDFLFICLPTPFKDDHIDLSIMDDSVRQISSLLNGKDTVVIIKSTVVPRTTQRYAKLYPQVKFGFNPEFLTEANHLNDFINTDRVVLGFDDKDVGEKMLKLYQTIFSHTPIFQTDTVSAEVVKYMANAFLMTKVLFANELYDLCIALGVNYDSIKEMVAKDNRIGESHLNVTQERGFGGKCFPKDLIAIMGLYKDLNIDHSILDTVWKKNLRIRAKRDWEDIPFVKSE